MEKQELLQMRLGGQSYQQIANQAGISRQRVQQILSPPRAIRQIVVAKFSGKCNLCGVGVGQSGHVHHKGADEIDTYNDLESLELLCASCHSQKHGELRTGILMTTATERPVCPRCGRPGMHKAGRGWSGSHSRQVWRCQGCGKTRMERAAKLNVITEYTSNERLDIRQLGSVWRERATK